MLTQLRLLSVSTLAAASTMLFTLSAFAQQAAPPPPEPANAPPAPAPAAVASTAKNPDTESDEEIDAKGRLWIGFNVGGGVGSGANLSGPSFDGAFRAGYVINSMMGLYGNLTGIAWVGSASSASNTGASVSVGAVSGFLLTPMFALTPADIIEVAAGPSLDYLSGGGVSASAGTSGASTSAGGFSSVYFGLDGRLALHLGGRNKETHRRRGFTLSADVHPSFVPGGPVTFITGGLGADWF